VFPPQTAAGFSPRGAFWGPQAGALIHAQSRVTTAWPAEGCGCTCDRRLAGDDLGVSMRGLKRQKGIAFDVADLLRARSWGAFYDWQFKIWLDHGTEDEEYDEVIAFSAGTSPRAASIMWRTAKAVFVQPLLGKRRRYTSVAEALTSLLPKQPTGVADIKAAIRS
jgi:hypothetical protein